MKHSKKINLLFILIILIFFNKNIAAQTSPTSVNSAPVVIKQYEIQKILTDWRVRSGIPAATLSIFLPDHQYPITFISGTTAYGNDRKLNSATLFQAGSITKSFTSTIILELEAQGKLNINDPITQYLPQYYPRWSNVTIRELLNHTSGIFNYTQTGAFNQIREKTPQAGFSPEEIVRIAGEHRDYFPPGKGWKYSNTNYVLAGMIIEKVTGQPVGNVINYYLHGGGLKLNLANTYYLPGLYSSVFMSRMAHGYSSSGYDVTSDNMSWANTAGAIVTTTEDLLTWWRGLFQQHILPPAQIAEMMSLVCEGSSMECKAGESRPHISEGGIGKGYGLGIIQSGYGSSREGTVWWHNGSTRGYKAIVMWYPKPDIYMSLTIDRDPGYLLKPGLPVIQHVLGVLLPDAEWHLDHPKPIKHFYHHFYHKKHDIKHETRERKEIKREK